MRRSFASHATCFVASAMLLLISGCYSMNGYMMNASGQSFYEQGNYAMAAAEFEKAVASDPSNPDYTANLARTRYKMGDVSGSEQIYRRNLTASPMHQPSYHGLAELMVAQGRGDEAAAMLTTWSATQPYAAESHIELAWLQKEMGQPEAAAQSLQQALRVNPGHPRALAHLGQYYQEKGQVNQAVAMYQQSLQSDWNQPMVHSRLANAAAEAGPRHPVNAMAMARGAGPQGFRPQMAQRPHPQPPMQMAQGMPPGGPWHPGIAQAPPMTPPMASPGAMAATPMAPPGMGMGFGFPMMAGMPAPTPVQGPVTDQHNHPHGATPSAPPAATSRPTPDPAFAQPAPLANPLPVTSVSHQSLMLPDEADAVPEVEAF